MKLWPPDRVGSGHCGRGARAFTLSEMMIASTIFMMVVGGVVAANIFGLRLIELTEPKQQAAQRARELFNLLSDDISTAWRVEVGTGDLGSFVPVGRAAIKQGSSLKVWRDALNLADVVVYHLDAAAGELLRDGELVAWGVTDPIVFVGEDTQGSPLTGDRTSMVVRVKLEFSELERTRTPIGPDRLYKSYRYQTRLVWRAR